MKIKSRYLILISIVCLYVISYMLEETTREWYSIPTLLILALTGALTISTAIAKKLS